MSADDVRRQRVIAIMNDGDTPVGHPTGSGRVGRAAASPRDNEERTATSAKRLFTDVTSCVSVPHAMARFPVTHTNTMLLPHDVDRATHADDDGYLTQPEDNQPFPTEIVSNPPRDTKRSKHTSAPTRAWKRRALKATDWKRTNDEVHSSVHLDPVAVAICDTPHFQRLRQLKQLGTTDMVYMNANHTRFEHSVGVYHLAKKMAAAILQKQPQLGGTCKDILCVSIAGLLHDLGHGAFSHIFDGEFLSRVRAQGQKCALSEEEMTWPAVDPKWKHEDASLMMIDDLLLWLGLEIDLNSLDSPLKQVGDGVDARSFRVFNPYLFSTAPLINESLADAVFESYVGARQPIDAVDEGATVEYNTDPPVSNLVLTSRDWLFIKECVWGKPLKENQGHYVGRPERQSEWLYDIVANQRSGLDVDKIDYFARDERRAKRASGEIEKRFIEEAVVAWGPCAHPIGKCFSCGRLESSNALVEPNYEQKSRALAGSQISTRNSSGACGTDDEDHFYDGITLRDSCFTGKHLTICYPEKMITAAIEFFRKRFIGHAEVYQHKMIKAAGYMIVDILCAVDPYFRIPLSRYSHQSSSHALGLSKRPYASLPIRLAMTDPAVYLQLNDSIIDIIAFDSNPKLHQAQDLIRRFKCRDLYKCIGSFSIKHGHPIHDEIWSLTDEDVLQEMLDVTNRHNKYMETKLTPDDFIVEKNSIHHGAKDKNPLFGMCFLEKSKMSKLSQPVSRLPHTYVVDANDERNYDPFLTRSFEARSIRVYGKNKETFDLVVLYFEQWVEDVNARMAFTTTQGPAVGSDDEEWSINREPAVLSQETYDGVRMHEKNRVECPYPSGVTSDFPVQINITPPKGFL